MEAAERAIERAGFGGAMPAAASCVVIARFSTGFWPKSRVDEATCCAAASAVIASATLFTPVLNARK